MSHMKQKHIEKAQKSERIGSLIIYAYIAFIVLNLSLYTYYTFA